jgi:hypothetical protein
MFSISGTHLKAPKVVPDMVGIPVNSVTIDEYGKGNHGHPQGSILVVALAGEYGSCLLDRAVGRPYEA